MSSETKGVVNDSGGEARGRKPKGEWRSPQQQVEVQRLTGKAPPEEKTLLCKWLCKRRILYCLKVGLFLLIGPLFRLLFAKVNIRPRGSPMVFGVQCVK